MLDEAGPVVISTFILDNAEDFNASSRGHGIRRVYDAKAAAGGAKIGCAKPLPDDGAYGFNQPQSVIEHGEMTEYREWAALKQAAGAPFLQKRVRKMDGALGNTRGG